MQCGDGGAGGGASCGDSVTCIASKSCDVRCISADSCQTNPVVAVAGQTAVVVCRNGATCNKGVRASAGDAGVLCDGLNCGPGITCDGGKCTSSCNTTNVKLCCEAGACTENEQGGCTFTNSCP